MHPVGVPGRPGGQLADVKGAKGRRRWMTDTESSRPSMGSQNCETVMRETKCLLYQTQYTHTHTQGHTGFSCVWMYIKVEQFF